MELRVFLFIAILFILSYFTKSKQKENMVAVNKRKNRNRKKQLKLLEEQEEKLSNKMDRLKKEVEADGKDKKSEMFECARKLSQARQEIETLEERII